MDRLEIAITVLLSLLVINFMLLLKFDVWTVVISCSIAGGFGLALDLSD
jgi:hypothetical protein